jgi:hypothetical protein
MSSRSRRSTIVAACVLTAAWPAWALVVAPPPTGAERVAKAQCIIVGRIVGFEDKDVTALP